MLSKIVALCALVAVAQAGLLAAPAHYSSAAAVSSQSIVRHDQPQAKLLAPVAKLAVAAPVYQAAPATVYHAAPAPVYHTAPSPIAYHAAPASVAYHAAPAKYSSAGSVSSQNIVRYDQPHAAKIVAPIAKVAVAAPVYHAAPAPVAHYSAPIAHYSAPVAHYSAPVAHYSAPVAHQEVNAHPKYEYSYSVADSHTGDNKSQQEVRDGDVVKGSYSFHEADGSIRTVEYSADDHSGFNAVVHNTAPTAAPTLIKAAHAYAAAPIYYKH